MAIHITPDMMERAYDLLRVAPPFRGWKLPPPDDVAFIVTRSKTDFGSYDWSKDGEGHFHRIEMSSVCVRSLPVLLRIMAHEICHMRDQLTGGRNDIHHGAVFNKLADQVCRYHGFDRGEF